MLHTIAQNAKSVTADGKYIHQYEGGELQGPAGFTKWLLSGQRLGWKAPVHSYPQRHFLYQLPCGVTLDNEDFVYVVDYSNYCVYKC